MKAVSNMEELLVQSTSGQGGRPSGKHCIRFGTVNVGTVIGRANEIAEMFSWKVDLCCLQETRWIGGLASLIKRNNTIYKFIWCGDQSGFGGVEIMLTEKWVNNVIYVKRYDHRCLQLRFLVGTTMLNVTCCYAAQSGLSAEENIFYEGVFSIVASTPKGRDVST